MGCGWEGGSVGGGGAFLKGMEHSGCRQTDWGNTWHKSQINKQVRERGHGYFPNKSCVEIMGTRLFISANTICSQSRTRLGTGNGEHFIEKLACSEMNVDKNFKTHNKPLVA